MLDMKVNTIYTKPRIYHAIEDIKKLCKETNCIRNKHIMLVREYEGTGDYNLKDAKIEYDRISIKELQKNDRDVYSQRMDLFLKRDLNKKLDDIYGMQEAELSIEGDDDKYGYQPASNISLKWQSYINNNRYWTLRLFTRPLDERLFSDLDYTLLNSDGKSTYFDIEAPNILKDFCKDISSIIKTHELKENLTFS